MPWTCSAVMPKLIGPMNIVIIDDHKLFRIGLIEMLRRKRTINVVAEYSDFEDFFRRSKEDEAELALVDINLGDDESINGIDLAIRVRQQFPKMKIAMLTMAKDSATIRRAIDAGVDGYFNKDIDVEELTFGLKKIMNGGKYFTAAVTGLLLSGLRDHGKIAATPQLSQREKQVLQYLVDGYSSEEMAAALKIGKRTIDSYRSSILSKFKMKNSAQLIKFVVEAKILGS